MFYKVVANQENAVFAKLEIKRSTVAEFERIFQALEQKHPEQFKAKIANLLSKKDYILKLLEHASIEKNSFHSTEKKDEWVIQLNTLEQASLFEDVIKYYKLVNHLSNDLIPRSGDTFNKLEITTKNNQQETISFIAKTRDTNNKKSLITPNNPAQMINLDTAKNDLNQIAIPEDSFQRSTLEYLQQNFFQNRSLQQVAYAVIDPMTGLFNRYGKNLLLKNNVLEKTGYFAVRTGGEEIEMCFNKNGKHFVLVGDFDNFGILNAFGGSFTKDNKLLHVSGDIQIKIISLQMAEAAKQINDYLDSISNLNLSNKEINDKIQAIMQENLSLTKNSLFKYWQSVLVEKGFSPKQIRHYFQSILFNAKKGESYKEFGTGSFVFLENKTMSWQDMLGKADKILTQQKNIGNKGKVYLATEEESQDTRGTQLDPRKNNDNISKEIQEKRIGERRNAEVTHLYSRMTENDSLNYINQTVANLRNTINNANGITTNDITRMENKDFLTGVNNIHFINQYVNQNPNQSINNYDIEITKLMKAANKADLGHLGGDLILMQLGQILEKFANQPEFKGKIFITRRFDLGFMVAANSLAENQNLASKFQNHITKDLIKELEKSDVGQLIINARKELRLWSCVDTYYKENKITPKIDFNQYSPEEIAYYEYEDSRQNLSQLIAPKIKSQAADDHNSAQNKPYLQNN